MRTFITLFTLMAVVFGAFVVDAEAGVRRQTRKCICTSPDGTKYQGCRVHGNACIGAGQHEHENTPGRSTALPIFCRYKSDRFLVHNEPSCSVFNQKVRQHEAFVRQQQREADRQARQRYNAQRRSDREFERMLHNSPFGRLVDFTTNEIRSNTRRVYRDSEQRAKRDIRNHIRSWYGY